MPTVIAQQQGATGTVIQAQNPPQTVAGNTQAVVIRVADGRQHTVVKVVETCALRQHQLIRRRPQINRRLGQAIADGRTGRGGQGKGGAAVLMIGPHHRAADHTQALGQRMAPAKAQAAIHLYGAGAIQARPGKWQYAIQLAIGQGQQFLAGDHGHRAAMGRGVVGAGAGLAVGVFRRGGRVVHRLMLDQGRLGCGFFPHQRHRIGYFHRAGLQRHAGHRLDRRCRAAQ
ncbi:hypothetical protein PSGE105469_16180 [Pseudomonas gessardii]